MKWFKTSVFAATAVLALSVPAAAQYPGGYYGGGYYGERGSGGYYGERERYDRRGQNRYDDDDRPRRDRRPPPSYGGNPYGGPPAAGRRAVLGNTCATPRGACRAGEPSEIGTPCNCILNGVETRGAVR